MVEPRRPWTGHSVPVRTGLTLVALVALVAGAGALALWSAGPSRPLDTVALVRELAPGAAPRSVHLRGIITYRFPGTLPRFVIQDATGGLAVRLSTSSADLPVGHEAEVVGSTRSLAGLREVLASSVVVRPARGLLEARRIGIAGLQSGNDDGRMVELEGIVEAARVEQSEGGAYGLWDVATAGGSFSAVLPDESSADAEAFVNARVRLRGVARTVLNTRGQTRARTVARVGAARASMSLNPRLTTPTRRRSSRCPVLGALRLPQHRVRLRGHLARGCGRRGSC